MQSLVSPSVLYRDSFLAGAAEFLTEGRFDSTYARSLGYDSDSLADQFPQFVRDLKALADATGSRSRYPDRVLWLVHDGEYIGQTSIRPELCTPYLLTYGGHIGYSIRPSRRCRGYGKALLALTLVGIAGNWAAPRAGHLRLGQHWFAQDHRAQRRPIRERDGHAQPSIPRRGPQTGAAH